MTNKASCLALLGVFLIIPAVLGYAASSDWWQSIQAQSAAAHARAEAMYDPID